jgi:hypothetical protein
VDRITIGPGESLPLNRPRARYRAVTAADAKRVAKGNRRERRQRRVAFAPGQGNEHENEHEHDLGGATISSERYSERRGPPPNRAPLRHGGKHRPQFPRGPGGRPRRGVPPRWHDAGHFRVRSQAVLPW